MASAKDPDDFVAHEFDKALRELKRERLAALEEAATAQLLLHSMLQHEALRIENKLGREHPRTRQLKAGLQTRLQLARALEIERQVIGIEVPEVADEAALVHGRIVDEDGLGIGRLIVCLVEGSGEPVREAGESTSDASGYFAIAIEPEALDRLLKQYPEGIFLAVFASKRRALHQEPAPLALARGARLFHEIRLTADQISEPPPPITTVVPDLIGKTVREATAVLKQAGLKLGERKEKQAPDQAGRVLDQDPAAGAKVATGSSVSVVIGIEEKETVKVPSLVNVTLKTAKRKIKESGLELGEVSGPSPTDKSVVEKQEPLEGDEVPPGTKVNLAINSTKK
ncbi:MAG TPA: PASTA domain-containing protein [Blastocatellia bacterium]|nr:PASTA domain-containing protein [Blastocatellia bacterium]